MKGARRDLKDNLGRVPAELLMSNSVEDKLLDSVKATISQHLVSKTNTLTLTFRILQDNVARVLLL